MKRYQVIRYGHNWNVIDAHLGNNSFCFRHGFEAQHVAESVARELNKAVTTPEVAAAEKKAATYGRYQVVSFGHTWNIVDSHVSHISYCFINNSFEVKALADEVAAAMNRVVIRAVEVQSTPVESMGLPFERWITLIRAGHADQVADEMRGAQQAMLSLLNIMDGERP